MATVTKRMLPVKLSALKRALYAVTGRGPAPAAAAAAPVAAPLAFRDGPAPTIERVREQLEREAARGPRVPRGPEPPKRPSDEDDDEAAADTKAAARPAPRGAGALAERRRAAGLRPGQMDPAAPPARTKREQELIDRKVRGPGGWGWSCCRGPAW
jgi:hypothetical protein